MITSELPTLDEPPAHGHRLRADAILARYLDAQLGSPSFRNRAGAARHFLHWVRLRHVPLSRVDAEVVQRFTRHRCQCASFSPRALQQPGYVTNVRRFVAFLEDQGAIPVPDLGSVIALLPAYGDHLIALSYSRGCRGMLISGAEHPASRPRANCVRRILKLRFESAIAPPRGRTLTSFTRPSLGIAAKP